MKRTLPDEAPSQPDLAAIVPQFDNGPSLWADEGDRWFFHWRTGPLVRRGTLLPATGYESTLCLHLVAIQRYLRGPAGPGFDAVCFQRLETPQGGVSVMGHQAHFPSARRCLSWAKEVQRQIAELDRTQGVYQDLTWEDVYQDPLYAGFGSREEEA